MEWVETTGKTIEEALDVALDQLGVDEVDAEYEVLGEAKTGLFGRLKSEARVRARVRPAAAPSKEAANNNRRRRSGKGDRPRSGGGSGDAKTVRASKEPAAAANSSAASSSAAARGEGDSVEAKADPARRPKSNSRRKPATAARPKPEGATEMAEEDVPLSRQGEVASEFLAGLFDEIEADVDVDVRLQEEDEIISISVEGENLGHLIGPKGATLHSLQELTRTVVQRQTGARNGRVMVDVGQYREKRREALERFSRQVAEQVLADGGSKVLEPMNPADRKIIHDLVGTIDGVSSASEGEEPRRRVVIKSDASSSSEVG